MGGRYTLLPVRKAISLSCDAHFPLSISHKPHNRHIPEGGGEEEGEGGFIERVSHSVDYSITLSQQSDLG